MITAEQKELRRKYIGSSDAAAILGCDPYKTAADVYLAKTGQADDFEGNDATDRGNLLEPAILKWAEKEIGRNFADGVMLHGDDFLAANFDGISAAQDGFIVEAKSSVLRDEWGDNGTDEVPERVIIQVHHAMHVAGPEYRLAYVPALLPGFKSFDFRMYIVERDDWTAGHVANVGREFMQNYIIPRIRPDDYRPSIEVLKRVRREIGKTIEIDGRLIDELELAKTARLELEKREDAAKEALWKAMDDAECGRDALGRCAIISTVKRKGYVCEASEYKQLKIKTPK